MINVMQLSSALAEPACTVSGRVLTVSCGDRHTGILLAGEDGEVEAVGSDTQAKAVSEGMELEMQEQRINHLRTLAEDGDVGDAKLADAGSMLRGPYCRGYGGCVWICVVSTPRP